MHYSLQYIPCTTPCSIYPALPAVYIPCTTPCTPCSVYTLHYSLHSLRYIPCTTPCSIYALHSLHNLSKIINYISKLWIIMVSCHTKIKDQQPATFLIWTNTWQQFCCCQKVTCCPRAEFAARGPTVVLEVRKRAAHGPQVPACCIGARNSLSKGLSKLLLLLLLLQSWLAGGSQWHCGIALYG